MDERPDVATLGRLTGSNPDEYLMQTDGVGVPIDIVVVVLNLLLTVLGGAVTYYARDFIREWREGQEMRERHERLLTGNGGTTTGLVSVVSAHDEQLRAASTERYRQRVRLSAVETELEALARRAGVEYDSVSIDDDLLDNIEDHDRYEPPTDLEDSEADEGEET